MKKNTTHVATRTGINASHESLFSAITAEFLLHESFCFVVFSWEFSPVLLSRGTHWESLTPAQYCDEKNTWSGALLNPVLRRMIFPRVREWTMSISCRQGRIKRLAHVKCILESFPNFRLHFILNFKPSLRPKWILKSVCIHIESRTTNITETSHLDSLEREKGELRNDLLLLGNDLFLHKSRICLHPKHSTYK